MRSSSYALLGALAPFASAFPAAMFETARRDPSLLARGQEFTKLLEARQTGADSATAIFEPLNTFNAATQFVNVSAGSGHEYVAPSSTDLRGPCPGLNAMANHLFLPACYPFHHEDNSPD